MNRPYIEAGPPMDNNPVWEICERVAEVQALLHDHIECGKYRRRTWSRKAQAVPSEARTRRVMIDVGYLPPKTPPSVQWVAIKVMRSMLFSRPLLLSCASDIHSSHAHPFRLAGPNFPSVRTGWFFPTPNLDAERGKSSTIDAGRQCDRDNATETSDILCMQRCRSDRRRASAGRPNNATAYKSVMPLHQSTLVACDAAPLIFNVVLARTIPRRPHAPGSALLKAETPKRTPRLGVLLF